MWNWAEDKIKVKITWIRHGMTKANEEHRYLGKTDEPLSEKGIRLLEEKKKNYSGQKTDLVYASPMKRCVETAGLLFPAEPVLIPAWEEMDFGQFEGKNYEELKDNPDYQKWIDSNGTLPFPGGETREHFIARCMEGFDWMMDDIRKAAESSAAAVVHGGTIMAVLSSLTGGEYFDFQVKNGEGYETVFTLHENGWTLDSYCKRE